MPFIQLGEKQLFYTWSDGKVGAARPAARTLLLLHGLGSSSSFYATVIPSLAQAGYSCLAIDSYGSGLSRYGGHRQDTRTLAADAREVLTRLGREPQATVVVGHSMGCIVASELAARDDFAGVVLVGAIHPSPKYADAFSKRIATVTAHGMEPLADAIPTSATGSKSTPVHHAFIRTLLLSQAAEGYASLCNAIITARQPDYAKIRCPVLFIVGAEDKTAALADTNEIMGSLGSQPTAVRVESLAGVGHWHCIEAADQVAALIRGFLEQIRASE
ncbi:hypothetical protein VTK73DRAFT_9978 [Phialemonium thermophilum]|uniref:Serine aminopeptidase S33 domain-containing protein n=1 Tax=Phialemonium thermophilum TaxID=223376 RepID=A0ABR3VZ33_9PEZI